MKVQNFSAKKAGNVVAQAGGLVGGMLLSNGTTEAIPLSNKMYRQAIVLAAGVAVATLVGGEDTMAKTVRSVGLGMAAQQAKELVKGTAAPHLPNVKFIKDSFEQQSLPASAEALNRALAGRKRRGLGNATPFKLGNAVPLNPTFIPG